MGRVLLGDKEVSVRPATIDPRPEPLEASPGETVPLHAPMMAPACRFGAGKLRCYPYDRTPASDHRGRTQPEEPWTVVVCPVCKANEVCTGLIFHPTTSVRIDWEKLMWQRLHGFVRVYRGDPSKGVPDRREYVASEWKSRHKDSTVTPIHLERLVEQHGQGKAISELFIVREYKPEEAFEIMEFDPSAA